VVDFKELKEISEQLIARWESLDKSAIDTSATEAFGALLGEIKNHFEEKLKEKSEGWITKYIKGAMEGLEKEPEKEKFYDLNEILESVDKEWTSIKEKLKEDDALEIENLNNEIKNKIEAINQKDNPKKTLSYLEEIANAFKKDGFVNKLKNEEENKQGEEKGNVR